MIAEAVFILTRRDTLNTPRPTVRDLLLPLINRPGLEFPTKHLYPRIFDLYTSLPLDYVDAYHAALVEQEDPAELYSFDRHFDRVSTVRRIEPTADPSAVISQEPPPR